MALENLPKPIQDWLVSDQLTDVLIDLGERYGLNHAPTLLPGLVFRFVSKDIDGPGFYGALVTATGGNRAITEQLIRNIKESVFAPVTDSLRAASIDIDSIGGAPIALQVDVPQKTVTSRQTTGPTPVQPTKLAPNLTDNEEAPFVLHQHEEETKPQVEAMPVETSPLRPMFYKASTAPPPIEEKALESRPIAARLELGIETQPVQESAPRLSRTPREEIRQVNYSEFRTPLNNPFAGTPGPKENEQKPPPETVVGASSNDKPAKKPTVPDTNVVNLKDLPL